MSLNPPGIPLFGPLEQLRQGLAMTLCRSIVPLARGLGRPMPLNNEARGSAPGLLV